MYSHADLLEVTKPNPEYRDNSRIRCKYFGTCSGCQYQVRPSRYPFSRTTLIPRALDAFVRDAAASQARRNHEGVPQLFQCAIFQSLSFRGDFMDRLDIPVSSIPSILPTMESPLQYGYRTKLTPHFELPSAKVKKVVATNGVKPDWFNIGFNKAGTRAVLDIEVSTTVFEGLPY